jgi:hypothetical protein
VTKAEATAFLGSIVTETVDMARVDAAKWAEFVALVTPLLSDPTLDPKYREALAKVNTVVDAALG